MVGDVGRLVVAAAQGDERAWNALVAQYAGLVWSVARGFRLGDADASDVSQTTWLRLVEHLDRLRDPDRVGAWLATTARNESLRILRRSGRQIPASDSTDLEVEDDRTPAPGDRLLDAERDAVLWRAFDELPDRCRTLLRVLMADPPPSYDEVSDALEMPIGSIGPTRGRCLERLRKNAELAGITVDVGDSA